MLSTRIVIFQLINQYNCFVFVVNYKFKSYFVSKDMMNSTLLLKFAESVVERGLLYRSRLDQQQQHSHGVNK
jgi:hypothetical protein